MSSAEVRTVPEEITHLLSQLRGMIRRYVAVEGVALVVALAGLLLFTSVWVDVGYFWLRRLELPVAFRLGFFVFSVGLIVGGACVWVAFRLLRSFRTKALALVLERRFPELDDRLITAVESGEFDPDRASPLTMAMLRQTVDSVNQDARGLDLGAVFDRKPMRIATASAVVLAALGGVSAVAAPGGFERWLDAYVRGKDVYVDRDTTLRMFVLSQPGDDVKDFREDGLRTGGEPGHYKHAKGSDLTLLVVVPKGERPDGEPWSVPERIDVRYRQPKGGGGRGRCARVTNEELVERLDAQAVFRYARGSVLEDMEIWITGGDFTNRRPYVVEAVDPPRLDEVVLESDYPAYTGWNDIEGQQRQRVDGTEAALPIETRFLFDARANKPLVNVRLEYGPVELAFGRFDPPQAAESEESDASGGEATAEEPEKVFRATMTVTSENESHVDRQEIPEEVARRFLHDDGLGFRVPFVLTRGETDAAQRRAEQPLDEYGVPFNIAPGTRVRVYLEDEDDILSSDPSRVTIQSIDDAKPAFHDVVLQGIGNSITRKATIPFAGRVSDDYGLANVRFEFKVDEGEKWRVRPLLRRPEPGDRDYRLDVPDLERSDPLKYQRFAVLPLDLEVGQRLRVTLYAEDQDDLNGPNVNRTEDFVFEIVSNEDLLALLYAKELDQRDDFEKIIEEIETTRGEVEARLARLDELGEDASDEQRAELKREIEITAERGLHQIRTSNGESRAIELAFADILEELVNNGIATRQMVRRINELIVEPLNEVNENDFQRVDEALGRLRVANEEGGDRRAPLEETLVLIGRRSDEEEGIAPGGMLGRMEKILSEMQDHVKFMEAINDLRKMVEDQQGVKADTENLQREELIKKLGGGLDLPEDDENGDDGGED